MRRSDLGDSTKPMLTWLGGAAADGELGGSWWVRASSRDRAWVLGAATMLFVPLGILTTILGEPFALSAFASTAAIVLNHPCIYRAQPYRVAASYCIALAVAIPSSLAGIALSVPPLCTASIAVALLVAGPAGRFHPPTACVPLAVLTSLPLAVALSRWALFALAMTYHLLALWFLTRILERHTGSGNSAEAGPMT